MTQRDEKQFFIDCFNNIADHVHQIAVDHGWWEQKTADDFFGRKIENNYF